MFITRGDHNGEISFRGRLNILAVGKNQPKPHIVSLPAPGRKIIMHYVNQTVLLKNQREKKEKEEYRIILVLSARFVVFVGHNVHACMYGIFLLCLNDTPETSGIGGGPFVCAIDEGFHNIYSHLPSAFFPINHKEIN